MIRPCPDHDGEDCPRCADEHWWPWVAGAAAALAGILSLRFVVAAWLVLA